MGDLLVTIDIEPTNRCNASCHFCPRDQTPHQGLMKPEVFDQTFSRAIEFREVAENDFDAGVRISLCGLGEPLLNKHTPEWIGRSRAEGFETVMSSNGALLDERRGRALLDAGLQIININVGDHDEAYDEVYKLPFERTRENVLRFAEMAEGQCQVSIVLVDYRRDSDHRKEMVQYWKSQGLTDFSFFDIMNRGGALFVDDMQFESYPELTRAQAMLDERGGDTFCGAPFVFLFIGYDGQYYLCCSDWKKEVPLGSVFDSSIIGVTQAKLDHVTQRASICKTCNWDPLNRMTEEIRAQESGADDVKDPDSLADELVEQSRTIRDILSNVDLEELSRGSHRGRRSIPIKVV